MAVPETVYSTVTSFSDMAESSTDTDTGVIPSSPSDAAVLNCAEGSLSLSVMVRVCSVGSVEDRFPLTGLYSSIIIVSSYSLYGSSIISTSKVAFNERAGMVTVPSARV